MAKRRNKQQQQRNRKNRKHDGWRCQLESKRLAVKRHEQDLFILKLSCTLRQGAWRGKVRDLLALNFSKRFWVFYSFFFILSMDSLPCRAFLF